MKLITNTTVNIHPRAIEAMGADLVTDDNIAILELVKNSYDAFAYKVEIEIGDNNSYLKIRDDGKGMSLDTITNSWATISTTFKQQNKTIKRNGKERFVSGNKGLGRLSAARLGRSLTIVTKEQNSPAYLATFDWDSFYAKDKTDDCKFDIYEISDWEEIGESPIEESGTILVIKELKSNWMPEVKNEKKLNNIKFTNLKVELERLLDPFTTNQFKIIIKYPNTQLSIFDYSRENEIIISHPLINTPPYKIKGFVDIDQNIHYEYQCFDKFRILSERKLKEPLIKTITWEEIKKRCETSSEDIPYHDDVKCGKFSFEIRVWDLDSESLTSIYEEHKQSLQSTKTVREIIANHKGISVYRNGVLVLPKSETTKDWLGLDKKRIGRVGSNLSTSQIIGKIDISLNDNPKLQDTSSREAFNKTKEYDNFFAICTKGIIQEIQSLRVVEKEVSKLIVKDYFEDSSPKELQQNVTKAVQENKSPKEIKEIVDTFSNKLNSNLKELQERVEYYAQLASAGTFSKVIIHELRNNVNPIQRFNRNIYDKYSPLEQKMEKYYKQSEDGCTRLINLSNAFSPLSKQSFKKEKHTCMLFSEVNNVGLLLNDYLENNKIKFENNCELATSIPLHPGEIQTVMINLIDNAIYWLSNIDKDNKIIKISSFIREKYVIVQVSDNGPGIDPYYGDAIFRPGVTSKPNGFGMGLVVVNEIISTHGGYLKNIQPGELDGATFEFSIQITK